MKSLMLLWQKVAEESATICCTSATLDIKTVKVRVEAEGISFLTITLPTFGKDFERGLDQGWVDRRLFQGFAWKAGLPRFLGGFLGRVFDAKTGSLVDEPCIESIRAIRQLTLMCGKIELECTPERERAAMQGYIDCEHDVRQIPEKLTHQEFADFRRIANLFFGKAFKWLNENVHHTDLIPKHGPGATADGLRGNSKFNQTDWPRRLERIFPHESFLLGSPSFEVESSQVNIVEPGAERPVTVLSVPKTLKTPRIIAKEPTAMQFAQQAVLGKLLESFGRDEFLSEVLGFDDQIPNQLLARHGSLYGDLATLDLSEASDRVSNVLVEQLVADYPQINGVIQSTRSRRAYVPERGVIPLSKFASMGSALCFPVEAMVFMTLILLGIENELNEPVTIPEAKSLLSGKVRVYGDDIIIPVEYVQSVVSTLQRYGFVVNGSKSFWTGKFRESCGKEYYNGEDVSIVRVREMLPSRRQHVTGVISTVSLRNQLYFAGYWKTVQWLDSYLKRILKYFPTVLPSSPVLGRHSVLGYSSERIGDELHNPLVKGYITHATIPSDPLDGSGALFKCLSQNSGVPIPDETHLLRAGRPKSLSLRLRWGSAV